MEHEKFSTATLSSLLMTGHAGWQYSFSNTIQMHSQSSLSTVLLSKNSLTSPSFFSMSTMLQNISVDSLTIIAKQMASRLKRLCWMHLLRMVYPNMPTLLCRRGCALCSSDLDGDLPDYFWPLAAACGIHIKNHVPHSTLSTHSTPSMLWMKKKSDLSHLHPFGCHVTSHRVNSDSLNKVELQGEAGCFVGYARDSKGYLIWFPYTRSILPCWDVVFHDMPSSESSTRDGVLWEDVPMNMTTPLVHH